MMDERYYEEEDAMSKEEDVLEFMAHIPKLKGAIDFHGSGEFARIQFQVDTTAYGEEVFKLIQLAKSKNFLIKIEPMDEVLEDGVYF